jgi:hypothetical protein
MTKGPCPRNSCLCYNLRQSRALRACAGRRRAWRSIGCGEITCILSVLSGPCLRNKGDIQPGAYERQQLLEKEYARWAIVGQ